MILRYGCLSRHPRVFQLMTGLTVADFRVLYADLAPAFGDAEVARLSRPTRRRAIGAGRRYQFAPRDQLLCAVVWLRQYPTNEALGYFFGVSDSTVSRAVNRWVALLAAAGKDTFRLPDPGRKHRREVDALLADQPDLVVLVDTFEPPVQRPRARHDADGYSSGQQKRPTLKRQSQVAIDEATGQVVDVAASAPGPTADITLLKDPTLAGRPPAGVGLGGDLAYIGADKLHPQGLAATPRRKPRGQERPPGDLAYNRAFARRRAPVEHTIGLMRRYQALTQVDRHHRALHTARVRAVAGVVNRRLKRWEAYRLARAA
jgi:DDE superfamily endonuclease/Helix-turn-helix of DDE superfamily endonuclease